ncbi:hypothetical protein [Desulfocastanea catecholica]
MKYAFIVLIALYLVIYGCSPDSPEKATESHEQTTPAAVEHAPQSEMVAVPDQPQETVAPAPAEQHAAVPAEPAAGVEATQQPAEVVEQPAEVVEQPAEVVEQAPGEPAIEAEQVVMPCGKMMALKDIPENAPCLKPHWQATPGATEPTEKTQDLAAALQRMIDTTNDMVLATKQLVNATQQLLNAEKATQQSTEVPQETPPAKQQ